MNIFSNSLDESSAVNVGVNRRSFLGKSAAAIGATAASVSLPTPARAALTGPTSGDIAILKFLAAAEAIEADLWSQYNELSNRIPGYTAALERIDPSLPFYIAGDYQDELSHADLINAYLQSIGQSPVNLDPFRTLPGPFGTLDIGRLTNLTNLTIDTSFYARYRSDANPDFGDLSPQIVTLVNVPTVPLSGELTAHEYDVIAQCAAFHFASIEQGGSSLYNALLERVTSAEVVGILASIGPTEVYHFGLFMTSLQGIRPVDARFPNISKAPTRAQITPHPCKFIDPSYPLCSVIRPRSIAKAGAVATVNFLVNSGIFAGQTQGFVDAASGLAAAADAAVRNGV